MLVAEHAKELVKRSGGSQKEQDEIHYIRLLHDIGKIGVADACDAMTSKRSYRGILPQHIVRSEFVEKSGIQFDLVYAKLMVEMIDEDTEYQMKEN